MQARLVRRAWLRRTLAVSLSDGEHIVEYDGTGFGFEQVKVDGVVVRERSIFWYVPRFEFKLGGWPSVVEIRVWPWLLLRSLVLRVKDRVVYAEGVGEGEASPGDDPFAWDNLA